MAFEWKALVELASTCAQQAAKAANPEAYYRTAANRAYFGAFGYAYNYSIQYLQYDAKKSPEDHGRLREHLRRKKRKAAADRLNLLRQLRNEADYWNDLPWVGHAETIESAIQQANELFGILPIPVPRP